MNPQQIAVLVVAATLGLLVLLLLLYGRPRRSRQEDEPTNFRRGDPDSVLEGPRLQRVQVWGVASAIFITGFLVVYFIAEPFRSDAYGERFLEASVERGEAEYLEGVNCAQCHGPGGEGGFASTDPSWPAPPLDNVFARFSRDEITRIVRMGRPGTPMPSWGIEFGGPLNEQKLEDIVNFVETLQVPNEERFELAADITSGREVFELKCAVCHGDDAQGEAMGTPLPTFFAPDLTTEFFRLGEKVARERVTLELRNELAAERADRTEPTEEEIQGALDALSDSDILEAGEEAARNTIVSGRPNTPMPAWQNRLAPEHIDAVMEYLGSIQTTET